MFRCDSSATRDALAAVVRGIQEIANYTTIKEQNIDPILTCVFIDNLVNDLHTAMCKELVCRAVVAVAARI